MLAIIPARGNRKQHYQFINTKGEVKAGVFCTYAQFVTPIVAYN